MYVSNLPQITLEAAEFAQRQVNVRKLLTEFLIQFFLEVTRTDVVDHRRLCHHDNRLHYTTSITITISTTI